MLSIVGTLVAAPHLLSDRPADEPDAGDTEPSAYVILQPHRSSNQLTQKHTVTYYCCHDEQFLLSSSHHGIITVCEKAASITLMHHHTPLL